MSGGRKLTGGVHIMTGARCDVVLGVPVLMSCPSCGNTRAQVTPRELQVRDGESLYLERCGQCWLGIAGVIIESVRRDG